MRHQQRPRDKPQAETVVSLTPHSAKFKTEGDCLLILMNRSQVEDDALVRKHNIGLFVCCCGHRHDPFEYPRQTARVQGLTACSLAFRISTLTGFQRLLTVSRPDALELSAGATVVVRIG